MDFSVTIPKGEWYWYRQALYKPNIFMHIYMSIGRLAVEGWQNRSLTKVHFLSWRDACYFAVHPNHSPRKWVMFICSNGSFILPKENDDYPPH
jgi:hypothetical protein